MVRSVKPATEKTAVKKTKKTTETPAAKEPVNEVVQSAAPEVAAAEAPKDSTEAVSLKMNEFSAKLQQLIGLLSTVKSDFKTLEKSVSREMKAAQKASAKKRQSSGNRKPSGFVKPARISDELAAFLGKESGTEMSRTDVSKEINAYIVAHKLKYEKNGRIIHPDAKLTKLLKVQKDDELTFFNLQRYMKPHFAKAGETTTTA